MDEFADRLRSFLSGKAAVKMAIAAGFIGMFLIFVSDFLPEKKEQEFDSADTQSFVDNAELDIAGVVRSITGEKSPAVYITAGSGVSKVYAVEIKSSDSSREEKVVIVKDSDGDQTGLLIRETQPIIQGVVVVSERAGDPIIREKIISAVKTAFDIPSSKVCVVAKYK